MINWIQTWANYYGHLTQKLNTDETHKVLCEERATQEKIITRAEEHLKGVHLFYDQSHLTDPHPPGEEKKGSNSLSHGHSDTIGSDPSQNTSKSADELSDREI